MFEKDIYQLIRGLRAHKGNEREYIQSSIKECRKEIRSQDMDQKATALLKLVYLEMFGHDMSWASFNVLEVMSSPKYLQKRVGYLAAVQSFRSDTEVLMLAENLLKKDLNSADKSTMALPLITIPHVINPSMANSLLTDLLPRLSHSHPSVRKKTIVTLYRLALVYPETLRPAWPKIKERLQDENEDSSVTAAIVNVVCELGWRRPQDFLPLAPRLFELLTAGNNNWMAIKIIKLFSALTPLEPRLVKKLLPPLTSLIKTTPAMSLLYECINGIIQGGIMEAAEGTTEGDEIARLCVNKLRAMLVVEGDPNLRYVALLAFAKITASHADLVSQHSDVILECIDDADISIRTRALDLVVGMVNANTLQTVVERLLKQLRSAGVAPAADEPANDRGAHDGIIPMADDDEDDAGATIKPKESKPNQAPPLPDDYRISVIERILQMCSRDTYSDMNDFEWYIGVLVELVKQCPATSSNTRDTGSSMADAIGGELQNVAVRVKAVRPEAAAAAQSLLMFEQREKLFPSAVSGGEGVLASAAFIAGEFADMLPDPDAVLSSLLDSSSSQLPAAALASYLQAVPKIFAQLTSSQEATWTSGRKSQVELIIARIVHFLEPLTLHPNLDIQERAVEYLDLMRLASEACSGQQTDAETGQYAEPPLLLTQAIPSLFSGMELNPVAPRALNKVPIPDELDLDAPINSNLNMLLQQADLDFEYNDADDEVYKFYHEKPSAVATPSASTARAAADLLNSQGGSRSSSYQDTQPAEVDSLVAERKRAERRERYKDDPYYIDSERNSGTSTPMHNILRSANGQELDVDSIPVMELKLDNRDVASDPEQRRPRPQTVKKPKRHFEIAGDETLGGDDSGPSVSYPSSPGKPSISRSKKSVLGTDSSGLSTFSLNEDASTQRSSQLDVERRQAEEEEMQKAIKEVDRLRLEMQRAQERINGPEEGTMVKRKKKKKVRVENLGAEEGAANGEGEPPKVKKKKKKRRDVEDIGNGKGETNAAQEGQAEAEGEVAVEQAQAKTKRKKKRQVTFDD